MEDKDDLSDGRLTFDGEELEDEFEEYDDEPAPGLGSDIRAHLYKWIIGLAVLVILVIAAVVYLLNPFGSGNMQSERVEPSQTAVMQGEENTAPSEPERPLTSERDLFGQVKQSPSSTYVRIDGNSDRETAGEESGPAEAESTGTESLTSERMDALAPSRPETVSASSNEVKSSPSQEEPVNEKGDVTVSEESEKKSSEKTVETVAEPAEAKQEVRTAKVPESPPPAAEVRTEPAPTPSWYVQVGAFRVKDNAVGMVDTLKKQGFPADVNTDSTISGRLHFAWVGPYGGRAEASRVSTKLKRLGYSVVLKEARK